MYLKICTQFGTIHVHEKPDGVEILLEGWTAPVDRTCENKTIFHVENAGEPGIIGPGISFSLDKVLEPIREEARKNAHF